MGDSEVINSWWSGDLQLIMEKFSLFDYEKL